MEIPTYPNETEEERRAEAIGLVFANLKSECRRIEQEHGFGKQTFGEDIALIHSELSEALEEFRIGRKPDESYVTITGKPEGVPSELADVVIRILGMCARHEIDIADAIIRKMAYNETRPFMHGGKTL